MKWYKQFVSWLSLSVLLLLPIFSHLDSYANETTSSGSDQWTMPAETFLQLTFDGFSKQISAPYVVYNTFSDFGYDGFRLWCENGDHWSVIEDGEVVGHGGGGYSRPSDKIDYAENIEVPTDIKNLVLNYVQYNVTQNPLPYKECYLTGFDFLDPSVYSNYATYVNVKYIVEHCNGYAFMFATGFGNTTANNIGIITVDRSKYDFNFIGNTTGGVFTGVTGEHNWSSITSFPVNTDGVDYYMVRQQNGNYGTGKTYAQAAANAGYNTTWVPGFSQGLHNSASPYNGTTQMTVMTSMKDKELIYVFSTLNAYKNYNAGQPQPYYLTSTGANTGTWTASGGGVINTGSMTNSGNYYSQVTNGVGSNWTPEQIIQLVDTVVKNNVSGGGSGGGSSSDNPFGFLGKLGDIIGQLVSGVGDLLTGIVDGIANVFLGTPDDQGNRQGGLFSVVRGVINGLVELIDTDFVEFFNVVFDWLPQEVITLMIAGLTFALFFGILKMIRG